MESTKQNPNDRLDGLEVSPINQLDQNTCRNIQDLSHNNGIRQIRLIAVDGTVEYTKLDKHRGKFKAAGATEWKTKEFFGEITESGPTANWAEVHEVMEKGGIKEALLTDESDNIIQYKREGNYSFNFGPLGETEKFFVVPDKEWTGKAEFLELYEAIYLLHDKAEDIPQRLSNPAFILELEDNGIQNYGEAVELETKLKALRTSCELLTNADPRNYEIVYGQELSSEELNKFMLDSKYRKNYWTKQLSERLQNMPEDSRYIEALKRMPNPILLKLLFNKVPEIILEQALENWSAERYNELKATQEKGFTNKSSEKITAFGFERKAENTQPGLTR